MSGGKGGSSSTEIPEWLKEPLLRNINRAEVIQQMEYEPYRGPEVAAFSPLQYQAFKNVGGAAEAFGMAPMGQGQQQAVAGINAPEQFAGGIVGYSSMPLYTQQQQASAATPEGQRNLNIRKELYSPDVQQQALTRFKNQWSQMPADMVTTDAKDDALTNAGLDAGE